MYWKRRSHIPTGGDKVNVMLTCEVWQEFHNRPVRMLKTALSMWLSGENTQQIQDIFAALESQLFTVQEYLLGSFSAKQN